MADIVERLRKMGEPYESGSRVRLSGHSALFIAAAEEIERLRAAPPSEEREPDQQLRERVARQLDDYHVGQGYAEPRAFVDLAIAGAFEYVDRIIALVLAAPPSGAKPDE